MFDTRKIKAFFNHHSNLLSSIPMIHIGGTNGKGSTAKMLENIYAQSYHVGLYTSPYDRERFDNISIDGQQISKIEVDDIFAMHQQTFESLQMSEFEIDTAIAIIHFAQSKCDLAIIEVGMGGLDDATNVITPLVSVITNVGTDHQDVLGPSVFDIATKKAGIIKPNVPIIIGPNMHPDAYQVIKDVASKQHAILHETEQATLQSIHPRCTFLYEGNLYDIGSKPTYQVQNACLVLKINHVLENLGFHASDHMIYQGLLMPVMSKRFEIIHHHPTIILDGAHNREGVQALIQSIKDRNMQPIKVIMGVLRDKPYLEMIDMLKNISHDITLTAFQHPRSLDLEGLVIDGVHIEKDLHQALSHIRLDQNDVYLITGSLYFLSIVEPFIKELIS